MVDLDIEVEEELGDGGDDDDAVEYDHKRLRAILVFDTEPPCAACGEPEGDTGESEE